MSWRVLWLFTFLMDRRWGVAHSTATKSTILSLCWLCKLLCCRPSFAIIWVRLLGLWYIVYVSSNVFTEFTSDKLYVFFQIIVVELFYGWVDFIASRCQLCRSCVCSCLLDHEFHHLTCCLHFDNMIRSQDPYWLPHIFWTWICEYNLVLTTKSISVHCIRWRLARLQSTDCIDFWSTLILFYFQSNKFRSFSFRPRPKRAFAYSSGVVPDSGLSSASLDGDVCCGSGDAVDVNDSSPRLPPSARLNRRLNFEWVILTLYFHRPRFLFSPSVPPQSAASVTVTA